MSQLESNVILGIWIASGIFLLAVLVGHMLGRK